MKALRGRKKAARRLQARAAMALKQRHLQKIAWRQSAGNDLNEAKDDGHENICDDEHGEAMIHCCCYAVHWLSQLFICFFAEC